MRADRLGRGRDGLERDCLSRAGECRAVGDDDVLIDAPVAARDAASHEAAWSAGEAALRTAGERSAEVLRRLHAAGAACVIQRNGPCRYSQDPKMAYLGLPSARTAALADCVAALLDEEANDRRT